MGVEAIHEPGSFFFRKVQPKEKERGLPRPPVGALSDGDGVNTLVDPGDTFTSVDVHEDSKGRRGLDTRGGLLMTSDLGRLHTCAET